MPALVYACFSLCVLSSFVCDKFHDSSEGKSCHGNAANIKGFGSIQYPSSENNYVVCSLIVVVMF